jgi:hypothetical protein
VKETTSLCSSSTTEMAVSKRGSSNEVGSAKTTLFWRRQVSLDIAKKEVTDESNIPKDMHMGARLICNGSFSMHEQVVKPVSSSKVGFGNRAVRKAKRIKHYPPHFRTSAAHGKAKRIELLFLRAATMAIRVASNALPS